MNLFYAQSWLLIHYLVFGEKSGTITPENMHQFLNLLDKPSMSAATAFQQAFGVNYDKLQDQLDEYRHSGRFTQIGGKVPSKAIRDKITSHPATDAEREIELTGLLYRIRPSDASEGAVYLLTGKYPDSPRPYEILADGALQKQETDEAADYLSKAIERKTQNPLVYVWLLRQMLGRSDLSLDYRMSDEICAKYRNYVDRALELAPNCMEAVELLAIIESQAPKMRIKLINGILLALKNMRDEQLEKTLLALGGVYYRAKAYESVENILKEFDAMPKTSEAGKQFSNELRTCLLEAKTQTK